MTDGVCVCDGRIRLENPDREEIPFQDLPGRHFAGSASATGPPVVMNAPHKRGASSGRAGHNRGHGVFALAAG
jgi:hypothetical protein